MRHFRRIHFRSLSGLLAAFALIVSTGAHAAAGARADLILRSGAIYTLDPARPWASALVVAQGRIVYVGNDVQADDPAAAQTDTALGPKRARWIMPIASIAAAGAKITAGSDWPSTSMNPLDGIQAAMTRRPLDGSKTARQPEETVGLPAILAAYTKNAAWAVHEDGIDGSIEVGKAADLIVLDRNLFKVDANSIHDTRVLLTLLGGEIVYRDPQSGP